MMENSYTRKIRIVHLVKDDKFFDGRCRFYDKLENVENRYFLFSHRKPYSYKFIKQQDKITLFHNYVEYIKEIRKADIVLFHCFLRLDYLTLCLISSKQKIIWWAWGFDIYDEIKGMPPLVNIKLYKPLTKAYLEKNKKGGILSNLKNKVMGFALQLIRRRALPKVDFMIPCLPVDYEILRNSCPYFRALPFPSGIIKGNLVFVFKENCGNVLIGNSLTYTNNHLDIFDKIKKVSSPFDKKFIVPISYGTAYKGGVDLINSANFLGEQVIWVKSFMDKSEYYKVLESVTHAIFGVIRQQALGNINYCLRKGIKVFLYNDSVVARQLRKDGYIIYSIDEDLTTESLSKPLSKEQALHNFNIYINRYKGRLVDDIQEALESVLNSETVK